MSYWWNCHRFLSSVILSLLMVFITIPLFCLGICLVRSSLACMRIVGNPAISVLFAPSEPIPQYLCTAHWIHFPTASFLEPLKKRDNSALVPMAKFCCFAYAETKDVGTLLSQHYETAFWHALCFKYNLLAPGTLDSNTLNVLNRHHGWRTQRC